MEDMKEVGMYDVSDLRKWLGEIRATLKKPRTKGELTMAVFDEGFVAMLLKVIDATERIVFTILNDIERGPVKPLMETKACATEFEEISKAIVEDPRDFVKILEMSAQRGFISDNDAQLFFRKSYALDRGDVSDLYSTEELLAVNKKFKEAKGGLCEAVLSCFSIIDRLVHYEQSLFEKLDAIDFDTLLMIFEKDARGYAHMNWYGVSKDLEKQIRKIKGDRLKKLSPDDWAMMMTIEEEAMTLAIKGSLSSSTDPRFAGYSDYIRGKMEQNSELIDDLLCLYKDDEVFDYSEMVLIYMQYDGLLNNDNYDLFSLLVLRAEIMHYEMNPEQRPRYDAWFNGVEYVEPERVCEEEPAVVNPKREKSVLTSPEAMKIWKKLQRKGWIDENLMPVKSLSKPKVALIASVITDVLNTEPRWSAIEKLWGIPNLANQLVRAQNTDYYNDFLKEIDDALK